MNNTDVRGSVSHIQHFSSGDGRGIRTTVFLTGCNLRCPWCHNPETHKGKSLIYKPEKCSLCGRCMTACESGVHSFDGGVHVLDREKCVHCFACTEVCSGGALTMVGKSLTVDDIAEELLHDRDFFEVSDGGITVSGGEPLLQPGFTAAVGQFCRDNKIDFVIETAGCVPYSAFERVMPYVSCFYFDVKANCEEGYGIVAGDGKTVFENAVKLNRSGAVTVARIPVIPGHNDTEEYFEGYAESLKRLGFKQAELMGFHRMGEGKYHTLGLEYSYSSVVPPKKSDLKILAEILCKNGISACVL